jgi:hypothetical protein
VKLSLDPSPGLPLGIACDIGFENRLALENTRLLMCYAMIDPTRVRTMVLFRTPSIHVCQRTHGPGCVRMELIHLGPPALACSRCPVTYH